MRIAYFTDSFYPHVDGVTTYLGVVSRELIKAGHEVLMVAPSWEGTSILKIRKFVPGIKVVLVPGIRPFFYPDVQVGTPTPKSFNAVKRFNPDLIHFHTPWFMGFEATILARLLKIPLINTFHTYYMEPEGFAAIGLKENGPASKILQESLWKISKSVHKPCDVVIAPTEYVGDDLKSRWNDVNVRVIPGAVDLSMFEHAKKRMVLRNRYGFKKEEVIFLSVGRLAIEKHYEILITAFSMMLMKYPYARLVFIGGGVIRKELEYIVGALGISHAVKFIGEIPYKKLAQDNYYSMGDVFVTPSTWDTQGLSVVEAMAAGLPVVAFNYRAMPEVIGSGGILVKHLDQYGYAKAMGRLAKSSILRRKIGGEARMIVRKYDIKIHLERLVSLYKEMIKLKELSAHKLIQP